MSQKAAIVGIAGVLFLTILFLPFSTSISFPTFTSLIDTPLDYSGQAGKVPTVNNDENALEFLPSANATFQDFDTMAFSFENPSGTVEIEVIGTKLILSSNETINSGSPINISTGTSKVSVIVVSGSDTTGTLTFNAAKVDRDTGVITEPFTEDIFLDGVNDVNMTSEWITNKSVSNDINILTTDFDGVVELTQWSFYQDLQQDFNISRVGITIETKDSAAAKDFDINIFKINKTGLPTSLIQIVGADFASNGLVRDRMYRLDRRCNDCNISAEFEGIHVSFDQTNIKTVEIILSYTYDKNISVNVGDLNGLTEADGNGIYVPQYADGTVSISGAQTALWDIEGTIRCSASGSCQFGTNQRPAKTIKAIQFEGRGNSAGDVVLDILSGRCAFGVINTEICMDFNNSSNSIGFRLDVESTYAWRWGMSGGALGIMDNMVLTSEPKWMDDTNSIGDTYWRDYQDERGVQPLSRQADQTFNHEDRLEFFGIPNDGIYDQNSRGDRNIAGSFEIDGNIDVDYLEVDGNSLLRKNVQINNDLDTRGEIIVKGLTSSASFDRTIQCCLTGDKLYILSSSASSKLNIEDIENVYNTNDIFNLRLVAFNAKNGGAPGVGLVAEEVEPYFPQMVGYDKNGGVEYLRYEWLAPLMLKELQDLRIEVDALQTFKNEVCIAIPTLPSCQKP